MKINILLITTFLSVIIYAGINFSDGITGATMLNGEGCTCHSLSSNDSVNVWIEGPDSVLVNQNATYKLYLSGGPAVAGGFNVAAFNGLLESTDSTTYVDFGELTHSFPMVFVGDTIYWEFNYVAQSTPGVDTIYSVANSVNLDGDPNDEDQWNFGENFAVNIVDEIIPVELVSFVALQNENSVVLNWSTATETNNAGFEIQRAIGNDSFSDIGFVEGNGTSAGYNKYSFNDDIINSGFYRYRLKQIDFDGNYKYSEVINLDVIVTDFALAQNFPNPFNPNTTISWQMTSSNLVTLKVYDVLGNEIELLVSEYKEAGYHSFNFDASEYGSGVYFYSLRAGSYTEIKKMNLIK